MFLLFDALVSVTLEKRGNAFFEKKGEGGGGQTKIVLTKRQCTLVRLADKSCNVPLSITRRDAFSLYTGFEKKRKKTLEFKNSLFYQIAYFYLFPFPSLPCSPSSSSLPAFSSASLSFSIPMQFLFFAHESSVFFSFLSFLHFHSYPCSLHASRSSLVRCVCEKRKSRSTFIRILLSRRPINKSEKTPFYQTRGGGSFRWITMLGPGVADF